MTATLPPDAFPMLDAPEFATIATSNPNGYPQLSVVWVERDGNDLLVSTIKGRRKYLNMERDPRVTVLVYPKDNPYSYVEVRGTVTMEDISIPVPGLSGITSVTFSIDGTVDLRSA